MNGLGASAQGRCQDFVAAQIGFSSRRRSNPHGFICQSDMQGVLVRVRVDRDGFDAHVPSSTNHSAGDLTTIGNQNLVKHRLSS